ncbi:MAG: YceD family protein [Pseudomonadota bacterium]|nr:YceD family protein [Pseudomonadota bacterium]
MRDGLPGRIDVPRMVSAGEVLSGGYAISELPRVKTMVCDTVGDVQFELKFGRNDTGRSEIRGFIRSSVTMTCQRCLEPVVVRVERPITLQCVSNEADLSQVARESEPLLLDDEYLTLADLIEDEMILALPNFPRHGEGQSCPAPEIPRECEESDSREQPSQNPFAALKNWRSEHD